MPTKKKRLTIVFDDDTLRLLELLFEATHTRQASKVIKEALNYYYCQYYDGVD